MNLHIEKIKERMKAELFCSAHNIDHVIRVYNLSKRIAQTESSVSMNILKPAALLHDIARVKESNDKTGEVDHAVLGAKIAGELLEELNYPENLIKGIKHCIRTHRYRSSNEPQTIEAKILFDADKLDALGSIGIARTFMLAGQHGQRIMKTSSEEGIEENAVENGRLKDMSKHMSKHTPFMEYEYKLKNIPERLYTKKGYEIGKERAKYMKTFFKRLKMEINGNI